MLHSYFWIIKGSKRVSAATGGAPGARRMPQTLRRGARVGRRVVLCGSARVPSGGAATRQASHSGRVAGAVLFARAARAHEHRHQLSTAAFATRRVGRTAARPTADCTACSGLFLYPRDRRSRGARARLSSDARFVISSSCSSAF